MFNIIERYDLNQETVKLVVEAPLIAKKARAGQFVVVLIDDKAERIPLTLADWDKAKGTITLIFQKTGFSTRRLAGLSIGDTISHVLGPLGHPTEIKNYGTVVCVAGGLGLAEIYPVCRGFKQAGNRVITIIGARAKGLLILENEIRKTADELFITTDDGSYGRKGNVCAALEEFFGVIEKSTHTQYPGLVYAIGPVLMMKAVSALTKDCNVKTIVSVNPIMVDATGMCASCRCMVAGKVVYGCVDGPDFDGHSLDFDELAKRLKLFKEQEGKI